MTSGGNNFNDFPENQLTKFQFGGDTKTLRSCIHLLHYVNTICPCTAENGTFVVAGRPRPERGTMRPKYGTSWEIRDGWQYFFRPPHIHVRGLIFYQRFFFLFSPSNLWARST